MPHVSAMRVWHEVQRLGATLDEAVKAKREARYAGKDARTIQDPKRRVSKLYVEADGMWVRTRGSKRHAEVKIVLAYEGKQAVGRDRRKLVGHQVVAGVVPGQAVWEEPVGAFSETWDLEQVVNSGLKLPKKIAPDSPKTADSIPQNHRDSFPTHTFASSLVPENACVTPARSFSFIR